MWVYLQWYKLFIHVHIIFECIYVDDEFFIQVYIIFECIYVDDEFFIHVYNIFECIYSETSSLYKCVL